VHAAVHGTGWSGRQHVGPALLAWSPARSEGRRRGHRRERRGAVEAQPLCYCFLLFILVLFSWLIILVPLRYMFSFIFLWIYVLDFVIVINIWLWFLLWTWDSW
jgi:hypothetical protein